MPDKKKPWPIATRASGITESPKFRAIPESEITDEMRRHMEETEAQLNFGRGRGYVGKRIPWNSYSEIEIQTILKIHFEIIGYQVTWPHVDDPSHERGIDLDCRKKRGQERVIIAVKKKPSKDALGQVVELSHAHASERIYIYVGGAAQSFRENIGDFESKVSFWDETQLEEHLKKSDLILQLDWDNSEANEAILKVMRVILKIIEDKKPVEEGMITSDDKTMEDLWGMKDRAVTLNKCAALLQLMFEDRERFGKLKYDKLRSIANWSLEFLYGEALVQLKNIFETLSPALETTLKHVQLKTKTRSNWFELFSYDPGFKPGYVKNQLQEYEKGKETSKHISNILRQIRKNTPRKRSVPNVNVSTQDLVADRFRLLGIWADGLEGTVDDMYERLVRGIVRP